MLGSVASGVRSSQRNQDIAIHIAAQLAGAAQPEMRAAPQAIPAAKP
jgi:hypothetical protein